jgi:toxin-antitoxin system PIN domain toxin
VLLVDTNVLVYAADTGATEHGKSRALIDSCRARPSAWYLSWGIVYEFVRVVTHPRVFRRPWPISQAWLFVQALLASPSLGVLTETDRHPAVAEEVMRELPFAAGNLVHDLHTAILMKEHGVRVIYTRDADFHRFPFLEVRDPMAA